MNDLQQREERIRALFPMVKRIARRMKRLVPGSDIDDLVGDGCIGAIRAVDTYDPARGALERFAPRVIAGAMLNGLRRLDPVSERVRRELRAAQRERYDAAARAGEIPTQSDMEKRRPALRRAVYHAYRYTPLSLDASLPPGERLVTNWNGDPAALSAAYDERRDVRAAIEALPPRQRRIVALHYFDGRTMRQIGQALQITPQRASQLHRAAIGRLRTVLHGAR